MIAKLVTLQIIKGVLKDARLSFAMPIEVQRAIISAYLSSYYVVPGQ